MIRHVFAQDPAHDLLDALIWLGAYRSDQAAYAVRLIQYRYQGTLYRYITNVLDPQLLPLDEVVHLYARRWDIELVFSLRKRAPRTACVLVGQRRTGAHPTVGGHHSRPGAGQLALSDR